MGRSVLTFLLFVSSVALAGPPEDISPGDRIIDNQEFVGTVKEVFSNGKVKVLLDAYPSYYNVRDAETLGKGVQCYERICVGNRIIDKQGYVGTAKEVFSNGKVKALLDAYPSYYNVRDAETLGRGVHSYGRITNGNRIINNEEFVGTVKEVFSNGQVKVLFDSSPSYYRINAVSNLGKGLQKIGNISVQDRMIDSSNNVGKIIELFDNGKAKVLLDSTPSYYQIRSFQSMGIGLEHLPIYDYSTESCAVVEFDQ